MPPLMTSAALGWRTAGINTLTGICDVALGVVAVLLTVWSFRRRRSTPSR